MDVFDLSEIQATYILDMPLRRLTKFSRIELENEQDRAAARRSRSCDAILGDEKLLRKIVSDELAEVAKAHGTPRRTVLLESAGTPLTAATAPLEVADDPCWVLLSSTGLLARTTSDDPLPGGGGRHKHDVGRRRRPDHRPRRGRPGHLPRADDPPLGARPAGPARRPTAPPACPAARRSRRSSTCRAASEPLALVLAVDRTSPGLALGTAQGVVKRVTTDYPGNRDDWEVIGLEDGDEVVGAVELATGDEDLVFVTSDAQLLRFAADRRPPAGPRRPAAWPASSWPPAQRVVFFGAVDPAVPNRRRHRPAARRARCPAPSPGSLKVTPYDEYPAKGRATGGVRATGSSRARTPWCSAWVGAAPARAAAANGVPVELPVATGERDGSGACAATPIAAVAGALPGTVVDVE